VARLVHLPTCARLQRGELASRLTLNVRSGYIEPQHIAGQHIVVLLMSVLDQTAGDVTPPCFPPTVSYPFATMCSIKRLVTSFHRAFRR
jgi:hypothetical protein